MTLEREEILKAKQQQIFNIYGNFISKAKGYPVGTKRKWGEHWYEKQMQGWKYVGEDKKDYSKDDRYFGKQIDKMREVKKELGDKYPEEKSGVYFSVIEAKGTNSVYLNMSDAKSAQPIISFRLSDHLSNPIRDDAEIHIKSGSQNFDEKLEQFKKEVKAYHDPEYAKELKEERKQEEEKRKQEREEEHKKNTKTIKEELEENNEENRNEINSKDLKSGSFDKNNFKDIKYFVNDTPYGDSVNKVKDIDYSTSKNSGNTKVTIKYEYFDGSEKEIDLMFREGENKPIAPGGNNYLDFKVWY